MKKPKFDVSHLYGEHGGLVYDPAAGAVKKEDPKKEKFNFSDMGCRCESCAPKRQDGK